MTRGFLRGYTGTLLPLAGGLVVIVLGWAVLADGPVVGTYPWASAVLAGTAWVLAAAVWLRRRGWRPSAIHAVTWIAPAAVLAAPATAGWLSADGLVLWVPAITVLAVSLCLATGPGWSAGCQFAGWGAVRPRAASARAVTSATSPSASIRSRSPSAS